jgi:hypothetical protein
MTKRDFFILLVKVFGLYSAVTAIFGVLPNNIMFGMGGEIQIEVYIWTIAVIVIVAGLFWLLTFKADSLVDFLKLSKGFSDDRIELGNIKPVEIIRIAVFITGGLLLIRSIPGLLSQIFWLFKGEVIGQEFSPRDKFNIVVSGLNVLLGYLLFTNSDKVARLLDRNKETE